MITVNITIKIPKEYIPNFEEVIRNRYEVISFKHLPDTEQMYETDPVFKNLVKQVKKAQKERDDYIFR